MRLIVEALQKKVVQKINLGVSIHDRDLMQFALAINRNMPDPLTNFCASPSWLNRLNVKKTEYLTTDVNESSSINVNAIELPRTSVFKYLGSAVASDGNVMIDVNLRTACPAVLLHGPLVLFYIFLFTGLTTPSFVSYGTGLLMSAYPLCSALLIMFYMKDYRRFIFRFLHLDKHFRIKTVVVATVDKTTRVSSH
ncbi:unnamed protein product [Heligmosomoides polygyrus]|uniref:HTH CENPB-type domain-containing protein n=1 Tax=Heligmosomoides polygyrus TaxID=6339 RepID=A0A183GLE5_HELPZ|nr:unnamed protein product [Heligmosomoides polygyrus]